MKRTLATLLTVALIGTMALAAFSGGAAAADVDQSQSVTQANSNTQVGIDQPFNAGAVAGDDVEDNEIEDTEWDNDGAYVEQHSSQSNSNAQNANAEETVSVILGGF